MRPATPGDADVCAFLALEPPGGLHVIVADPSARLRIARATFLARGTAFGWERTLVADLGGRVVGMAARFARSEWSRLRLRTGIAMLGAAHARDIVPLIRRGRLEERAIAPIPPGRMYVMSLAVEPSHRRRGIGARLLDAVSQEARRQELAAVALDVAGENDGAVRFYVREGFVRVSESRVPGAGTTPAMTTIRMERGI